MVSDLDLFRDLRGREAERRAADRGLFFAESPEVVARIGRSGAVITHVVASERRAGRLDSMVLGEAAVTILPEEELYSLVGFEMHRGIIAAVERPSEIPMPEPAEHPMIAVLEGINDHQNLGAIIRSGVALGVSAFVLDPTTAYPFYRRCVRVSMGTVASAPFVRSEAWPDTVEAMGGWTRVALTPLGETDLSEMTRVAPVAIMLGAEGAGLSERVLDLADVRARIPMGRDIDSINVAHAAAIAFHHFSPGP